MHGQRLFIAIRFIDFLDLTDVEVAAIRPPLKCVNRFGLGGSTIQLGSDEIYFFRPKL